MLPWAPDDGSLVQAPDKRRMAREKPPDCRFVERDEFMRLLVGTKELIRADEASVGLRGLLDSQNNLRFLIDEVELFGGQIGFAAVSVLRRK